jgi:hypothetical protein
MRLEGVESGRTGSGFTNPCWSSSLSRTVISASKNLPRMASFLEQMASKGREFLEAATC